MCVVLVGGVNKVHPSMYTLISIKESMFAN